MRIELGGLEPSHVKESEIASRLLLDGASLALSGEHWRITPWQLMTDDPVTISAFLQTVQDAKAITLQKGAQNLSLIGLKAALLFIDAQQKRRGERNRLDRKGDEPPLSVPPAPALKGVAVINPTPTPLTQQERSELLIMVTGASMVFAARIDPLRREMRVTALTDDKALLMIGCEAGAYNTIDLAWIVSRAKPLTSSAVRLSLPFKTDAESRDMELTNATFDEKSRELVTLAKGRGLADCGIQTRWRYDGQRFRLARYAQEPSCDNCMDQMPGPHCGSRVKHFMRFGDDVIHRKAEEREQLICRSRFSITGHADNCPF